MVLRGGVIMPKPSAATGPYYDLVHKLIKSTTEDEIMSTIRHFMENNSIYHNVAIDTFAENNRVTIQKLYFDAIKHFNEAIRYNKDADDSSDILQKDSLIALAEQAVMSAEELLDQYNFFKYALGDDFMPNHNNIPVKELADAYLRGLDESPPLTDYQVFHLAYHHANAQTPANQIAKKIMESFNHHLPNIVSTHLHRIYLLVNTIGEIKLKLLVGTHNLHSATINEIYSWLYQHKETQKQLSFFRMKIIEKKPTRDLSLQTYVEAIKQLDKEINQLIEFITTSILPTTSGNTTTQMINLSQELSKTHKKLEEEKADIVAFHYKKP